MRKGFSLIELMVVVGLIAILGTIAVPYYLDYANKSKVALAALVLNDLNTKAIALYNEGKVTSGITSLNVDGIDFADNSPVSVNYSQVSGAVFLAPGDGYIPDNEWMFCVYVSGLNFDGYSDGIGGAYSRLCSKTVVDNGIFTQYCGTWTSVDNGLEIPAAYLPDNCNNAELDNI